MYVYTYEITIHQVNYVCIIRLEVDTFNVSTRNQNLCKCIAHVYINLGIPSDPVLRRKDTQTNVNKGC